MDQQAVPAPLPDHVQTRLRLLEATRCVDDTSIGQYYEGEYQTEGGYTLRLASSYYYATKAWVATVSLGTPGSKLVRWKGDVDRRVGVDRARKYRSQPEAVDAAIEVLAGELAIYAATLHASARRAQRALNELSQVQAGSKLFSDTERATILNAVLGAAT